METIKPKGSSLIESISRNQLLHVHVLLEAQPKRKEVIVEVMGLNPVGASEFFLGFHLLLHNCEDHRYTPL